VKLVVSKIPVTAESNDRFLLWELADECILNNLQTTPVYIHGERYGEKTYCWGVSVIGEADVP
jgi:hypothetical protein